jgi:hypothetical protein
MSSIYRTTTISRLALVEASIVIKNQIAMMQGDDLFAGRGNTLEWGEQNVVDE